MELAIIISNTNDPKTGTATVSLNLARQFVRAGHACRVMFRQDVFKKLAGVPGQLFYAFVLPFYRSLWSYDVLDINAGDGLFLSILLRLFKPASRPLLVARSHGLEHVVRETYLREAKEGRLKLSWKYPLYHGGYRLWQVKKYLQQADLIFLLNAKERDYAVAHLGLQPDRIRIVDNGLPDAFIGVPFEERNIPPRVAIVGTFSERKGARFTVPALIALLQKFPLLEIGFFGTNSDAATILAQFPQALLPRIHVTPKYEHENLPALLADYAILLMASLADGYGMVGLEGMASGLALVATDVSGIAERLTDGENAILIPPGSVAAIEQAVAALLEDPATLRRLRHAGHAFAQDFSWGNVAANTLAFYREAIEKKVGEKKAAEALR